MTAESQPVSYVVLAKEVREAKTRLGLDREAAADVALELARRTVRAARSRRRRPDSCSSSPAIPR